MLSEKRKEYLKNWHILNKEKRKEQRKNWHFDKDIANRHRRELYANNPEKFIKRAKEWKENNAEYQKTYDKMRSENKKLYYINNKDNTRNNSFKRRYGITLEQYNQMFNEQEGKCKICNIHQDKLKRSLVVDHNHGTKKVRGLLCHKCNSVLGYVNDNIQLLEQAIEYLKANS